MSDRCTHIYLVSSHDFVASTFDAGKEPQCRPRNYLRGKGHSKNHKLIVIVKSCIIRDSVGNAIRSDEIVVRLHRKFVFKISTVANRLTNCVTYGSKQEIVIGVLRITHRC